MRFCELKGTLLSVLVPSRPTINQTSLTAGFASQVSNLRGSYLARDSAHLWPDQRYVLDRCDDTRMIDGLSSFFQSKRGYRSEPLLKCNGHF